jgi:putative superfamily III holin-X
MEDLRNRSIGELFGDLSRDTATLVRKELELARVEMARIATLTVRRASWIAVGALLALGGFFALVATAVLAGIAFGLSPVVSALLVTVLLLAIGGTLVAQGIAALRRETFVPTETIRTIKDTAAWARTQAR